MKLKPCPFCGSEVEEREMPVGNTETTARYVYTECDNPDCPIYWHGVLVGIWNTRPLEDKQADEIQQLKEELDIKYRATKEDIDEIQRLKEKFCLAMNKLALVAKGDIPPKYMDAYPKATEVFKKTGKVSSVWIDVACATYKQQALKG